MQKIKQCRIQFCIGMVIMLAAVMAAVWHPTRVQAADQPVAVTSCKLNGGGTKLTVKAKVSKKTKEMGSKLYLLNLNAHVSETGKTSSASLASAKAKKGTVTFKVKYKSSMLFQKFVVACKSGKKYKIISDARYITNPEALATFKGAGPSAPSKKGLQVEELSDSLEIGTKHAVVNWTLNSLLNQSATHKLAFKYKNKTYTLDADVLASNDELVQAYNAAGVRVTVILLLPKDAASKGTASMQFGGHSSTKFSSIKTTSKAGCQTFEAVMTYLAGRYGTKQNLVCGWILGNEVNSAVEWNYGGNKSLSSYMANYARAFRICYNAVKSVSKKAKVYISLDNNWNRDVDGSRAQYFSSKDVLDKFYANLKAQGKIGFQIAYHAYPEGMTDPVFWDDAQAANSVNASIINFKNINVLTSYAKKQFGKTCTVMLSEQSFNSSRGEAVQAAAYAYAYYISEGNSMIEAFIYGREFDHPVEINQGFRWGLCDNWHSKRLIWSVFQYIDTKDSFTFTDPLLKYTNIKKWSKISGFKKTFYTKKASIRTKAEIASVEPVSTSSLSLAWKKINTGDGYEIYRNDKLVATIAGNSTVTYTDKNLKAGTAYTYKVRMYKEAPKASNANMRVKLYGDFSAAGSATVSTGPTQLNEEKCKVNGNQITVAWSKVAGVSGYEISRSLQENGTYAAVGNAASTKTSYTDKDLISGTTYYYKVRAYITVNGQNYYGKYSDPVGQVARIKLTVAIEDGKVVLNWTRWQNATDYRIYCKPLSSGSYIRTANVKNALTYSCMRYRDLNAEGKPYFDFESGTYAFRVRAVLANGYSPYSDEPEIVIDASAIQPAGAAEPERPEEIETEMKDTEPTEAPDTEDAGIEPDETEASDLQESGTEPGETEAPDLQEADTEPGETEAPDMQEADSEPGQDKNAGIL